MCGEYKANVTACARLRFGKRPSKLIPDPWRTLNGYVYLPCTAGWGFGVLGVT